MVLLRGAAATITIDVSDNLRSDYAAPDFTFDSLGPALRSFVAFCWEPTLEDQSAVSGACQIEIRTDSDAAFPNAHASGEHRAR